METQHTNHTLQEKALKLKKQRRRQILASLLGIAILAWGIVEVACLFLDYKHTETSNDAQIEQYNSPVNLRASGYIKKIYFTEHQDVRKGDTLLVLDDREYRIRVMEAEAALKDALAGATVIDATLQTTQNSASVYEALKQILTKQSGDRSGLVYGIGHAVYTKSDPRAQILKTYSYDLSRIKGFEKEYDLLCMIEKLAPEVFKEVKGTTKNICANVDLFSGLIYRMLGIDEVLFTPIFAIARAGGWCAHRMEEIEFNNRIIRPAYAYCGERGKPYFPLDER